MKKNTVRILSLVLAAVLLLGVVAMGVVAMAASPDKLYFKPAPNWKNDGARFAAYFFGNGETWVSLTDADGDGIFECAAPAGYPSVIFCRMNGSSTENNWNNKWNQTADLTIPTDGKNCFTGSEGAWDDDSGSWSTIEVEDDTGCNHVMDFGSTTTAATCTTAGVITYSCTLCDYTKTEAIPATGHSYTNNVCTVCGAEEPQDLVIYFVNTDNWSSVYAYTWTDSTQQLGAWPGKAMTLVEGNLYSITVPAGAANIIFNSGNNGIQTDNLTLDAAYNRYTYNGSWDYYNTCAHTYDSGSITTSPTCTAEGVKTYTCTSCGHTKTETVLALGHMYTNGTCLLCGEKEPCNHSWNNGSTTTAATCTENGVKTYTCLLCSETKTETIYATGHKYSDGICYQCGAKEPVIEYVDIATAADLIAFANRVNAGENAINGRLVADIDLAGASWTPIGIYCPGGDTTKSIFYRGIFNGNGHTVSNFTVSGTDCVGLFGYAEMATIMNVGVINATMTGWNAGAVIGYAPTSTIINCYALNCIITGNTTNPIAINSEAVHVGAVAGPNGGTLKNCYAANCTLSITFTGQYNSMSPVGGTIPSNNYYCNVSGAFTTTNGCTSVTASQMASGEVAYKLQGSQAEAVWGQTIGQDSYPVIYGQTVYFENGAYVNKAGGTHSHSYTASVTAPTCTTAGYTTYTCACGDTYVGDEVAALGHAAYTYSYASTTHSFTCTKCGETVTMKATDSKKFAINSAAPVLSDDIVMKYNVTIPAGFENPYMVFEFNGEISFVNEYTVDASSGRLAFKFPGINPQKMGDNICATLYAFVDGVPVSVQIASYSMVKNCDNQLKNSTLDAKTRTLLSDVLIYGVKTQLATEYKTDVLVTSLLTDASSLTPSTFPEALDASLDLQKRTGTADSRVQFTGVTLSLGAKMAVRVAVTCTDTSLFTYKVTISGREYTYKGEDLVSAGSDNKYYLYFNQMKATEFGEKIVVTAWEGDTQVSYTIEYSVYSFVYRNYNKSSVDEVTKDLLKAIYNYGESTK